MSDLPAKIVHAEIIEVEERQLPAISANFPSLNDFLQYLRDSVSCENYDRRFTIEDFMQITAAWEAWQRRDEDEPLPPRPVPKIFTDIAQQQIIDRLRWIRTQAEDHNRKEHRQEEPSKEMKAIIDLLSQMLVELGEESENNRITKR